MQLTFPEIDPIIFSISVGQFTFALRWYALAYIAGLLMAWRIMVIISRNDKLWKDSKSPILPRLIEDLMTYMILGVILGTIFAANLKTTGLILFFSVMTMLRAAKPKYIVTTASIFILINSISGVVGQLTKKTVLDGIHDYWILLLVVLVGGQIGNFLNIKIFSTRVLAFVTSVLVLLVALRMGIKLII